VFYGYIDCTDGGQVFYVGKGKSHRLIQADRNEKHTRVSVKHGRHRIVKFRSSQESLVFEWERAAIKRYGTYRTRHTGIGCNFTIGGEGLSGHTPSTEALKRMSAAQIGRKHTPETRAKMSVSAKNSRTVEWRSAISEANSKRVWSDESRRKWRESRWPDRVEPTGEVLLADIRRVVKMISPVQISRSIYKEYGEWGLTTISRRIGSWGEALGKLAEGRT
jgi:hypothetical protein